jgi:hypothetical protein
MSQSPVDNILDSITIGGSQPCPQANSTAIQDVTNKTMIKATNLNMEGSKGMKKKRGADPCWRTTYLKQAWITRWLQNEPDQNRSNYETI